MSTSAAAIARAEADLRRATWTLLGHALFFAVCAVVATVLRSRIHATPPTLALAALVALVLFSRDIWRWLRCRDAVRSLHEPGSLSRPDARRA